MSVGLTHCSAEEEQRERGMRALPLLGNSAATAGSHQEKVDVVLLNLMADLLFGVHCLHHQGNALDVSLGAPFLEGSKELLSFIEKGSLGVQELGLGCNTLVGSSLLDQISWFDDGE